MQALILRKFNMSQPSKRTCAGLVAASSHLHMAHTMLKQVVKPGDIVIDATCGNGQDSLFLAGLALTEESGLLYALDIQKVAVSNTYERLVAHIGEAKMNRVRLLQQNHASFPEEIEDGSVSAVTYNLGYLPGSDKTIITVPENTVASLNISLRLLKKNGLVSVLCYNGHSGGQTETNAVDTLARSLCTRNWKVFVHEPLNRPLAPVLYTIYRAT